MCTIISQTYEFFIKNLKKSATFVYFFEDTFSFVFSLYLDFLNKFQNDIEWVREHYHLPYYIELRNYINTNIVFKNIYDNLSKTIQLIINKLV